MHHVGMSATSTRDKLWTVSESESTRAELLQGAPWVAALTDELRRRVFAESRVAKVNTRNFVCRRDEVAENWIGVLRGLVKIVTITPEGQSTSFIGVPSGGWFGEGSLLKNEARRYDGIALRDSTIAYVPRRTFMLLLDSSTAFNRFLLDQLNERLGQFVAMVEYDRLLGPDAKVAKELAGLCNPVLYPGIGNRLPISQEEIAQLVGLSRQRVNKALRRLEKRGLVRLGYKDLTILDLDGLRHFDAQKR
jgi:CRP-like cAMP-binding protein